MNSTLTTEATVAGSRGSSLREAHAALAGLRRRARTGIWIEALGLVALLLVAYALPSFLTDRSLRLEWTFRCVLLASFVAVVVWLLRRRLVEPLRVQLSDEEMALAVERRSPEIKQALISSLQFDRDLATDRPDPESRELKAAVVADVRARIASIPFGRALDGGRVARFAAGLGVAIAAFGAWAALDAGSLGLWARRNLLLSNVEWPRHTALQLVGAADGELRVPEGDALTVRVAVQGEVPDQVFTDFAFAGGETGTEPMSRTGDGEFTLTLDAVVENASLRIYGGDAEPVTLRVAIVGRPKFSEFAVTISYPSYMEREPEAVPATEGELRLPLGSRLGIAGRATKPIGEAFALFGGEHKTAFAVAADGVSFTGDITATASGTLLVDVVDRDLLGAASPPRLLLRVGEDKAPTIEFRLRGISTMVTAHARVPGELKVRDDFGLRGVEAGMRAIDDAPQERDPGAAPATPVEAPFAPAQAVFGETLAIGSLRYETTASIDLRQWNTLPDEAAAGNPIKPGMLLSLRFGARDNYGPGEPHVAYGETMTFRVVTREKLVEELRRRQVEQRELLQQILDEEIASTLELREMVNPKQAGDKEQLAVARLRGIARRQQGLGRRTALVGESYQRILWEYENNRLIDSNQVRQLEAATSVPLADLAKVAFPETARLVASFADLADEATRKAAVDGYGDIQRRVAAILAEMEHAETLAALLEDLRAVIVIEDDAIRATESHARALETEVFGPGKDTAPPGTPDKPKNK